MNECKEHEPRWVDISSSYECGSCGALIATASGICAACKRPMDDHAFFYQNSILDMIALKTGPICPTGKLV